MNRFSILLLFFILLVKPSFAALMDRPVVDERVELLSIVFRLADCDEYTSTKNKEYVDRIQSHFTPFKDHKLIKYTQKIRKYGIGYDAVMQMAIHIGVSPEFKPLKEFNETIPEQRWGEKRAKQFLELLRDFYTYARCKDFFEQEKGYYSEIVEAFMPVYDQLELDWYSEFYGAEPTEKFIKIIAPGIGGNNYGPHLTKANGEKEIYAILGVWEKDQNDENIFSIDEYFPILLHEFNHSFVNPVMGEFRSELEASGKSLFELVSQEMRNQAYGDWEVMLMESVVRAAVIQYMKENHYDDESIEEELQYQFYRGFIWIEDLVSSLDSFQKNRKQFSSFKDFMPELINAFGHFSENKLKYIEKYDAYRPKILRIEEFENESQNVDAALTTITIHFSEIMLGHGYSINYGELGKKHFPEINEITYSEDKLSVTLHVALKPKHEYQLILLARGFRSAKRIPIKDYEISFRTK